MLTLALVSVLFSRFITHQFSIYFSTPRRHRSFCPTACARRHFLEFNGASFLRLSCTFLQDLTQVIRSARIHKPYAASISCSEMSAPDHNTRRRPGPRPPEPDTRATLPSYWAKRTGFKPKFSGETNASDSGQMTLQPKQREARASPGLEAGRVRSSPAVNGEAGGEKVKPSPHKEHTVRFQEPDGASKRSVPSNNMQAPVTPAEKSSRPRSSRRHEQVIDVLPQVVDDNGLASRRSRMKYELRDSPGLGKARLSFSFNH